MHIARNATQVISIWILCLGFKVCLHEWGLKEECKPLLKFRFQGEHRKRQNCFSSTIIVSNVEKHEIPRFPIKNLDQTPLKYIPVMSHKLAEQNSESVSIAGSSDKRSITGTFTITFNGQFLMQLVYGGKTKQKLLRFRFSNEFSLSSNPKHFRNSENSSSLPVKLLCHI